MTVLDVLRGATDYLGRKGVDSPRLNAEYLLAKTLGKEKRLELYLEFDRPMDETERTAMREMTRSRGDRIPLQHILGTADFFGYTFKCDSRALIPRPETEQLVELVFKKHEEAAYNLHSLPSTPIRAVDIGTGSGVIALTLALKRPSWCITATDISTDALTLARENADTLKIETVTFREADLLPSDTAEGSLDIIVANLPYIADSEISTLQHEVQHDPLLALAGGTQGTEIIERLIPLAHAALRRGGMLALELGEKQPELLASTMNNWSSVETLHDYQDRSRFLFATK